MRIPALSVGGRLLLDRSRARVAMLCWVGSAGRSSEVHAAPRWIEPARGFEPRPSSEVLARWLAPTDAGPGFELQEDEEGDSWRVQAPTFVEAGIPVFSDSWEVLHTEVPPESRLRFTSGFSPLGDAALAQETYRIRLDDQRLIEAEVSPGEYFEVDLPPAGMREAKLTFEIVGGSGLGDFFVPTIRFLRARSTAARTLPAISSVLTGLCPGQHGATEKNLSLSRSLLSIADTFGQHGYRTCTGADSGFFSSAFGLDQGFDLFVENRIHHWELNKTTRQSLDWLDADDGRPTLLIVHTYRVHGPYREGPDESTATYKAFMARGRADLKADPNPGGERHEQILLSRMDEWVAMYEAGVRDLDQKFGVFLEELTQRGLFDEGALVFLADHDQAHGENNDVSHGGKLWDTKLRVPLSIHGAGIEPGAVQDFVSLVDVPPTLAKLAGLPLETQCAGTSLFDVPSDRPSFTFRLEGKGKRELAILVGDRKVFANPDAASLRKGKVNAAFDIRSDPGELRDLAAGATWPSAMARKAADTVEVLLMPREDVTRADVNEDLWRRLAEIGYTGN